MIEHFILAQWSVLWLALNVDGSTHNCAFHDVNPICFAFLQLLQFSFFCLWASEQLWLSQVVLEMVMLGRGKNNL